jgi:hypothetical protein
MKLTTTFFPIIILVIACYSVNNSSARAVAGNIHDKHLYTASNGNYTDSLEYSKRYKNSNNFIFKHKDKKDPSRSFNIRGTATNIDPDGNASFEEFDPEGKGGPTEIDAYSNEKYKCSFYVPLTESPIIGVEIKALKGILYNGTYKVNLSNKK